MKPVDGIRIFDFEDGGGSGKFSLGRERSGPGIGFAFSF